MSTCADSARRSTLPSANADRPRSGPGSRHIRSAGRHVAAMRVPEPLRHEERGRRPASGDGRVGNDGGCMHDSVLHMGGRETRGISFGAYPDRSTAGVRSRLGIAGRSHRALVSPAVTPGLDPGSSLSGTALARLSPDRSPGRAWTPDRVRGDKRGAETRRGPLRHRAHRWRRGSRAWIWLSRPNVKWLPEMSCAIFTVPVPQVPTLSGAPRPRSAAITLRPVILPVPGFSSDGTFSIFMLRRALSASTTIW